MKTRPRQSQSGLTIVVVLLLMSVMIVGAMSLARMTEIGTLASGNVATKNASLLASEVGLTRAFNEVLSMSNAAASTDIGGWYYATQQPTNASGLPQVSFNAAPSFKVDGRYTVRFVVDRMCSANNITPANMRRLCLLRKPVDDNGAKVDDNNPKPMAPSAIQYRVTVRVTDDKGGQTWVQSLMTKGSGV